jgi:peroxiredoxin
VLASAAPEARGGIISRRAVVLGAAICGAAGFRKASAQTAADAFLFISGAAKPAFALPDIGGANVALTSQRGRPVLVHFFATWCEPCRDELAALRSLVAHADGHITVVAISVAEVPLRVRRFMEQNPVNYPVLLDEDRAVTKSWDVSVLPTTFVLDAELKPRFVVEHDLAWDQINLDQLLAMAKTGITPGG